MRIERLMFPDPLPDWLHAPVGLSIGAEGPEEISVSIMAELLKIKNTTTAKHR
ncbi:XdhC/CoxF family protein [Paenibacillus sp. S3N08]|uniref:XdhC/CoxF family protein n=1 Tax=Paenibacillus agricola TaxID=2716264 RepID=A0ABX0JB74_9BACL|nr:XdhC/CoxF family protein [Paenibacillus agricola]